jgi:raffinose/stachyose/melibiose transport system permease protein
VKQLRKKHWKKIRPFTHGILLVYAAIVAVPIVFAFINSFKTVKDIQQSFFSLNLGNASLKAYESVVSLIRFGEGLRNNITILVMSLLITIALGSLAAFAMVIVNNSLMKKIYFLMVLIICVPIHAFVYQLLPILKRLHLANTYLGTSLVFSSLSLPIAIFLYTGFMRTIPREISEAAVIDGCSLWRIYLWIYMPIMSTVTGTVVILRGTYIWNNLLISMVTITDASKTMLIPRTYAFNSSTYTRWDLVLASSMLVSAPVTILYILLQKSFIDGITAGAVKG